MNQFWPTIFLVMAAIVITHGISSAFQARALRAAAHNSVFQSPVSTAAGTFYFDHTTPEQRRKESVEAGM